MLGHIEFCPGCRNMNRIGRGVFGCVCHDSNRLKQDQKIDGGSEELLGGDGKKENGHPENNRKAGRKN